MSHPPAFPPTNQEAVPTSQSLTQQSNPNRAACASIPDQQNSHTFGRNSSLTLVKTVRSLQKSLLDLYAKLQEEQVLLERLWYKSHAQFRSAKWFRSIDSVRRGLRRILGEQKGRTKANRCKKRKSSETVRSGNPGQLMNLLLANVELYYSLFGLPVPSDLSIFAALPKVSAPLNGSVTNGRPIDHITGILRLIYLLSSLQAYSRSSFIVLRAHLNTPPAPTFAPLVTVLLAIVSKVECICEEALFRDERDRKLGISTDDATETTRTTTTTTTTKMVGLAEWYERERGNLAATREDDKGAVATVRSKAHSLNLSQCPLALQRFLDLGAGKGARSAAADTDQQWALSILPLKLHRPDSTILSRAKVERQRQGQRRKKVGLEEMGRRADAYELNFDLEQDLDEDGLPPVPKKRKGLWEELSLDAVGDAAGGGGDDDLGVKV